jgi:hypothetical protein
MLDYGRVAPSNQFLSSSADMKLSDPKPLVATPEKLVS